MMALIPLYIILGLFGIVFLFSLIRSIRIVPAKSALVVERLGKYSRTLEAGFHLLIPFIEKVRYKHNLKEMAIDVPVQTCFTQDNVKIEVDGVLYLQVKDPKLASYGIRDYLYATIQLAQTTMRSVIGKLELDKAFEERDQINAAVVKSVDEASDAWGVKVSRYEIQNINIPSVILQSMEVQLKAEREKRAEIARSIGEMESKINYSQAAMEEAINKSEGEKQRMINEAEGRAREILSIAKATAEGIREIAHSLSVPGGDDAVFMRVSQDYIRNLSSLAKKETSLVLPMDVTDIQGVLQRLKNSVKDKT